MKTLLGGKKEGQQMMVRVGAGKVELHGWSSADSKWTKIGDVLGEGKASEGKKMYLGQEYDVVFDVDVDEGRPPLKLPYNKSEDPWVAAQKFIHENELPQSYLDTVAKFVVTNCPGAGSGAPAPTSDYADPLTGERYVPGATNGSGGGGVDPYTGEGRYVPGSGGGGGGAAGGDPLTSEGRYIPGSGNGGYTPIANLTKDVRRPVSEDMPLRAWKRFEAVSARNLLDKLSEFNSSPIVPDSAKLLPEDLTVIEATLEKKQRVGDSFLKSLEKIIYWPIECLVPVLDVFRVAILSEEANAQFLGEEALGPAVLPLLCQLLDTAQTNANAPIQILVCRAIANAFVQEWGRSLLLGGALGTISLETLVGLLCESLRCPKPAAQIAAASALANFAFALLQLQAGIPAEDKEGSQSERREKLLRTMATGLEKLSLSSVSEPVLFIILQSLVTCMWGDGKVINVAKGLGYDKMASRLKDTYTEDNGKTIARAIEHMLEAEIVLD